jgi:ABC-type molybdate transport system ATPase subunit
MMNNGQTIPINCIQTVHQAADGTIWLDVELLADQDEIVYWQPPSSRLKASINASHVIAAFELWDT